MEPRPDDGDDRVAALLTAGGPPAAMEPRPDDGDDAVETRVTAPNYLPQWSPALTTGTTGHEH